MKMLILALSVVLTASSSALAQDKAKDVAKTAASAPANTAETAPNNARKGRHERLQGRMLFCIKEAEERKLDGERRKKYIDACVKK